MMPETGSTTTSCLILNIIPRTLKYICSTTGAQVLVCGGKGLAGQYFTSCLTLSPQDEVLSLLFIYFSCLTTFQPHVSSPELAASLKHVKATGVQQRSQPRLRSLGFGRVIMGANIGIHKWFYVGRRSGSARYTTEFLATGSTSWVTGSQVGCC